MLDPLVVLGSQLPFPFDSTAPTSAPDTQNRPIDPLLILVFSSTSAIVASIST